MRVVVAALLAAGLVFPCGCRSQRTRLPNYGAVPEFVLTSQDGRAFDSSVLNGKIWVADFIFTTCAGACPRMSARMRDLQKETSDVPGVRFVSFTIDPTHDTPPQLRLYAKAYRAEQEHWYFLTGPRRDLDHLGFDVFRLNHVDDALQHSTRFVLVDPHRRIRGYYDSAQNSAISRLLSDIRELRSYAN